MKYRPYQLEMNVETKKAFMRGDRAILNWLNTGGGKSVLFRGYVKDAVSKGTKTIVIMRRKELVLQAYNHIIKDGVKPSIIMAGQQKNFNPDSPIQICSIDTIHARLKKPEYQFLKDFKMIVIDEAHDCTSPSYHKFFMWLEGFKPNLSKIEEEAEEKRSELEQEWKAITKEYREKGEAHASFEEYFNKYLDRKSKSETLSQWANWRDNNKFSKIYIGLTATPFMVGKKYHDLWDSCIQTISSKELMEQGFLTDADVYAPEKQVDVSQLKVGMSGDYKASELFEAMGDSAIVGDIVDTYKKYGNNRPAILFAVHVAHSKLMAEAFNRAGINAIHCDADTPTDERERAIKGLKDGKYSILCNVNIFSTGVDIPQAEIGIMARPTASEILFIQQLGRLLRPCKICGKCGTAYGAEENCYQCGYDVPSYVKGNATILDHGNNSSRFGLPFDHRNSWLGPNESKNSKHAKPIEVGKTKICPACQCINPVLSTRCRNKGNDDLGIEACGHEFIKSSIPKGVKEVDGELVLVTEKKVITMRVMDSYNQLLTQARRYNWKKNAVMFKLYEIVGEDMFLVPILKEYKWVGKIIESNRKKEKANK